MHIVRAQQVHEGQNCLAPCSRGQVALLLGERCGDEDLLVVGVGPSGGGAVQGPLSQFSVMGWAMCVTREEDGGKEDQEDQDVGYGEDGPVDESQDGSLAATGGDVVLVDGAIRQFMDARYPGTQAVEP